jgi:phosphoglycolate phosphatase
MLLLFDIDGTLLLGAAGEHEAALREAICTVHHIAPPAGRVETAGRTDGAIARSLLTLAGVDAKRIDDGMAALRTEACEAFARRCPPDLRDKVSPGMSEVLAALADCGHVLSLVTGNFEPIARLKLRRAGIGTHFAAGQGGFGSDSEDRAALPAVARRRAGRRCAPPEGPCARAETIVVGDTPRDIACAQADGVRCVAITTGPFRADQLQGADAVVETPRQLAAAIAALASEGATA